MIGAAKLLTIITAVQLGFVPGCLSVSSQVPDGLLTTSPTATPETRSDCDNPETGWKIERLNGKVKSLREDEIDYGHRSPKKELIRLVTFAPTGVYRKDDQRQYYRVVDYSKIDKPTFVFDKNCRVLERSDPKRPNGTRTVFSYTPSGTLREHSIYDAEGHLQWKSVAVLDENERILERKQVSQEHPEHFNPKRYDVYRHTRSLFKEDDAGNQIEEVSYDWKGNLYATYKRVYDPARRLIRELRLDHRNRPINLVIYKFDGGGPLREELKHDSSTYSGPDELTPGTLDSGFGMFQSGYRIFYEYDKFNNWVKQTEFDLAEKGKLSRITHRALIYY